MKIVVDARSLGVSPSGVGIYIYNFIRELVKHDDLQFYLVTDIAESREIKELEKNKVQIISYGKKVSKSLGLYGYFKFVQKLINQIHPEIFWEANNLIPIKVRNPYGKIMVTIHDMFPLSMSKQYGRIYCNYFRIGMLSTLKCADILLYNSVETKKEVEKYFVNSKQKKNFVSSIIVDCQSEEPIVDEDYFLYIGNLEKRKGTDILFKAYEEYHKQGGTKALYVAGKMREKDISELYNKIECKIEGLEYLGYIDEKEKEQLYARCACFLFPSRAEGFGIPIIEAMHYDKPIIASKLSIFIETVENVPTYFELDQDDKKAIDNLTKAMRNYKLVDMVKYKKIINKFTSEKLGMELYDYLKCIANN